MVSDETGLKAGQPNVEKSRSLATALSSFSLRRSVHLLGIFEERPLTSERALWLAWSQIEGVGPILLQRLQEQFGTLAAAWTAPAADLLGVNGIGLQLADAIAKARNTIDPPTLLQSHEITNPHFWTPADADYPQLLLETFDSPPVLYYRGIVVPSENQGVQPMIGIVGTRNPSDYGRKWTQRLTRTLVEAGFTIVSGLAEGIDTCAHRACLEGNGRTLAILGTGVDQIYPWTNRALYHQLVTTGLALSEYPAGTKADRVHFPRRNRIIAGLCRAVIVMEAPERSGALITAHLASDYGRDVYVLPGSLDHPQALGCLALLNQGAQVILGENHLLELLGSLPRIDHRPFTRSNNLPPDLPPEQKSLLTALSELHQPGTEGVALDQLVYHTGLPTGTLSAELLQLELEGLVIQLPGMMYRRA